MTLVFTKRIKRTTSLVIVAGIIGLTLISLLPWISVTDTTSSGTTETVYHDIVSMENSADSQINGLTGEILPISICFWMLIIFGLLSFIGMIILLPGKHTNLAKIIVIVGCANVVFSALAVLLNFRLIKNIESMTTFSLAPILGFNNIPIKYAHLILITGFVAFIGSISYAGFTIFFSIKDYRGKKKQQYDQKTMPKQFSTKKQSLEGTKETPKRIQPIEKRFESEEKIPLKKTIRQEYYAKQEHEQSSELKKSAIAKQPAGPFITEEQPLESRIKDETKQEKSSDSDEVHTSPLFEKALSSALEKIQPETKKEKIEQKQPEQQPARKRVSVRCSECKNVFSVEKGEFETKIECPHCGTKGIIKQ